MEYRSFQFLGVLISNFFILSCVLKFQVLKYTHFISDLYNVEAQVARFAIGDKPTEYHVMFHVTRRNMPFAEQLSQIQGAFREFNTTRISAAKPVFVRYFLSDSTNQIELLQKSLNNTPCAVSIVEQAPLNGTKIALWGVFQTDFELESSPDAFIAKHNGYSHIWNTYLHGSQGSSEDQTRKLLADYVELLRRHNITLADNCMRTWFYVRNIDINYEGVVKARREMFATEGLTTDSHFVASTGIGGCHADSKCSVVLDAYALKGFKPAQIQYLQAKDNFNRTSDYGVTFERGTAIHYGDRTHVLISGTASINNKGEVVCSGDVSRQADRMLDNVCALLSEAKASVSDVASVIIYLRDIADYSNIKAWAEYRLPDVPKVFVLAKVCRPGWLIEMECEAIIEDSNPEFTDF